MLDLEMDDIIATAQKVDAEKAEESGWLDLSKWDSKELLANLKLSAYLYRPEILFVSPQDLEDIKTSIDPVPPQEVPEDLDFQFEPDFFDFDSAFVEWTPEEEGRQLEIIRGRSRDYGIVDDVNLGEKEENFTPFGRDADVYKVTSDDVAILASSNLRAVIQIDSIDSASLASFIECWNGQIARYLGVTITDSVPPVIKWSCSHKREEKDSICPVCATFGRRVEI